MKKLSVTPSPHTHSGMKTAYIMLCVLLALLPAAIAGCLHFGIHAAELLGVTTGTAILSEMLCLLLFRRKMTVTDCSAAVTGLLLGMILPPDLPLWQGAAGSFFAVVIVKQIFGGVGQNFVNPALTARVAMMLAFTQQMTAFRAPAADAVSSATPLITGNASFWDLLLGNTAGCIGETCSAGLLLGGIFLMLVQVVSPVIPLTYLGSFALLSLLFGFDTVSQLLSGGILLAALFMANDPVTSPLTASGKFFFGIGCGCITFIIRHYGGYPEGAAYAILIMNLLTPMLDRRCAAIPFGVVSRSSTATKKQKKTA